MEKLEILTKMISDICNNEKYQGAVFSAEEDYYFAFGEDKMYEAEWYDLSYMTLHFTEEERNEVERIEKELNLSDLTFLPIRGGVAYDLQSLIEYYAEGGDCDEDYDEYYDDDYDEDYDDDDADVDVSDRDHLDVKNKIDENR